MMKTPLDLMRQYLMHSTTLTPEMIFSRTYLTGVWQRQMCWWVNVTHFSIQTHSRQTQLLMESYFLWTQTCNTMPSFMIQNFSYYQRILWFFQEFGFNIRWNNRQCLIIFGTRISGPAGPLILAIDLRHTLEGGWKRTDKHTALYMYINNSYLNFVGWKTKYIHLVLHKCHWTPTFQ